MVLKLSNKVVPAGLRVHELRYLGRRAREQGDFGVEVGAVDMLRVDERGIVQGTRYVHLGVVAVGDEVFVYMESGRVGVPSWTRGVPAPGLEFSFTPCTSLDAARRFFRNECLRLNLARLVRTPVWAAKVDARARVEQAWLVSELGGFVPGLPVRVPARHTPPRQPASVPASRFVAASRPTEPERPASEQAEVVVRALVHEGRATQRERGREPSLAALEQVATELRPLVERRLAELAGEVHEPAPAHTPPRTRTKPGRLALAS
jgi:hypothetical protein